MRYLCPAESNQNNSAVAGNDFADNANVAADVAVANTVFRTRVPQGVEDKSLFQQYIDHPVKIYHNVFTSASTEVVVSTDVLQSWVSNMSTNMVQKLANFSFLEGTFRIKVVVQGAQYAQGLFILSAVPRPKQPMLGTDTWVTKFNRANAVVLPHVPIDVSKSAEYEIDLPMSVPNGFYSLGINPSHRSYALYLSIYSPIASGTAVAPSINICVYASMINFKLHGLTQLLSEDRVPDPPQVERDKKQGGILSGLAQGISRALNIFVPIFPEVAPELTLFSSISSGVGSVLKFFGFSKPPTINAGTFITNRNCANYSQVDGENTSIVLGRSQTHTLGLSPDYGLGKWEDMSLEKLCAIPAPVITNQVLTFAAASEAFLFGFPVGPCVCLTPGGGVFNTTPLAGCALPFNFWCGDILVKFQFVASIFHRETVLIAWDPLATNISGNPTFADALTTLHNTTVQISGNTEVTIRIPWMQPMPFQETGVLTSSAANGTALKTNGVIYVYCVNPVQTMGSTDPVNCNVYFSSDNIALSAPTAQKVKSLTYQSETLSSDRVVDSTFISFGAKTDLSKVGFRATGDVCNTVKEITSRASTCFSVANYANTNAGNHREQKFQWMNIPHFVSSLNAGGANAQPTVMSLFGYFAAAYNSYRGSIFWSVNNMRIGTTNTSQMLITHEPRLSIAAPFVLTKDLDNQLVLNENAYAFSQPNLGMCSQVDCVAPMIIQTDFLFPRGIWAAYSDTITLLIHNVTVDFSGDTNIITASGDDGNFGWFLGFPLIA